MDKLVCAYCGKESEEKSYWIDASPIPGWVKHKATGEITCPDCYPKGAARAKKGGD